MDTLSLFQGSEAVYSNAGRGVGLTLPQPPQPTWDRYHETWAAYLAYEFAMGALETDSGFVHDALVGPQIWAQRPSAAEEYSGLRVEYLVEDTVQKHELSTVEDLPLHGIGFFEPLDHFEVRIPESYVFVGAPYRLLDEFNAP